MQAAASASATSASVVAVSGLPDGTCCTKHHVPHYLPTCPACNAAPCCCAPLSLRLLSDVLCPAAQLFRTFVTQHVSVTEVRLCCRLPRLPPPPPAPPRRAALPTQQPAPLPPALTPQPLLRLLPLLSPLVAPAPPPLLPALRPALAAVAPHLPAPQVGYAVVIYYAVQRAVLCAGCIASLVSATAWN